MPSGPGFFVPRLNLNLREVHAYTYGAHSAFDWRRAASPFLSTPPPWKTAVTADALREILTELTRIREAPVTADELSLAISYLIGVFPILVPDDGPRWLVDRPTWRSSVCPPTTSIPIVIASARSRRTMSCVLRGRISTPARLQVVIVGDATAIEQPLTALGVGPVTVYDPFDA